MPILPIASNLVCFLWVSSFFSKGTDFIPPGPGPGAPSASGTWPERFWKILRRKKRGNSKVPKRRNLICSPCFFRLGPGFSRNPAISRKWVVAKYSKVLKCCEISSTLDWSFCQIPISSTVAQQNLFVHGSNLHLECTTVDHGHDLKRFKIWVQNKTILTQNNPNTKVRQWNANCFTQGMHG